MLGVIYMLAVALLQSVMLVLAKLISPFVTPLASVLFYYFIPLLFLLPKIFAKERHKLSCNISEVIAFCARGFLASMAVTLFLYSSTKADLAVVSVLFNSMPIFVTFFSAFLLKEKVQPLNFFGGFLALLGVYFVLKPEGLLVHGGNIYGFTALLAAILMALAVVMMRKFAIKKVSVEKIVFYLYLFATFWAFIYLLGYKFVLGLPVLRSFQISTHVWVLFVILAFGVSSLVSQKMLTKAFSLIPASIATPILFTSVIFSSVLGYLIWQQELSFISLLGIICVVVGVIFSIIKVRSRA